MTTPARDPRRWWVLAAAVASLVAVGVDSGAVVLALPTIRHALRLTTPEVVAVLAAPALTLGLLAAPAARAASRWGARRVLLLGLAGVGLGSLGAATAGSGSSLVAARVLTGAGGAAALPAALTVLVGAFDDDQRDRALAIWAAFGGLLLVAAPLAAGALVVHAGWRPVFGSAAGLAGVALLLTGWRVAPARGPTEALPASEPLEPGACQICGISRITRHFCQST